MEWIDVKDRMPEKEGKILVLIGEKIFVINVYVDNGIFRQIVNEEIYCNFRKWHEFVNKEIKCVLSGTPHKTILKCETEFIKPSHYAEITHWCEVPELPK